MLLTKIRMVIRMEIKINPEEESPKTLRELAHFLLRLSKDRGKTFGEIWEHGKGRIGENFGNLRGTDLRDTDCIKSKGMRAKDIFGDSNRSDSTQLNESNGQLPNGMFSLFDAPINSANNSGGGLKSGFGQLMNNGGANGRSSDGLAFLGKDSGRYKDNSDEEKSEMVYDISEFFY